MKRILVLALSAVFSLPLPAWPDSLAVMFWNLENFYDCTDSGMSGSDREFSPDGERRWTKSRYWRKCHGVAKTVLWIADRYGAAPGVIGVAEVENRSVMQSVIRGTVLRKYGYVQIHEDSPDRRGIDVALLYRSDLFSEVCHKAVGVNRDLDGNTLQTRDILYVCLECRSGGERLHFLVNHHPSKYGGEKESRPARFAAMREMVSLCDSLILRGERNIVCMGDFNDTPDAVAFSLADGILVNAASPLASCGRGTIRYGGKWEMIDMFLTDRDLAVAVYMEICFPEFLAAEDKAHSGFKPLRTYTGPRYSGGISDHLPVILLGKTLGFSAEFPKFEDCD